VNNNHCSATTLPAKSYTIKIALIRQLWWSIIQYSNSNNNVKTVSSEHARQIPCKLLWIRCWVPRRYFILANHYTWRPSCALTRRLKIQAIWNFLHNYQAKLNYFVALTRDIWHNLNNHNCHFLTTALDRNYMITNNDSRYMMQYYQWNNTTELLLRT